ncbi:DUF975 family protein [Clostridium sp.]|uniref:DUF975 family protein n=1 Tax=Clostridium sp. TaxID=1506 RepID=UPI0034643593
MNIYNIKKSARESLKGNWGQAVLCCLIFFFISTGLPYIGKFKSGAFSFLLTIAFYVLLGPLNAGLNYFFLKLSRKEAVYLEDLFYPFKNFLRYFLSHLLTSIFSFLWSIPAAIVTFLAIGAFLASSFNPYDSFYSFESANYINENFISNLILLFIILIVIGVCLQIFLNRYALSHFILLDNPLLGSYDAIEESVTMMKGYKLKLFLLNLSFIGWGLLCILTLGIGLLWLLPYIYASIASFYDEIKKTYDY